MGTAVQGERRNIEDCWNSGGIYLEYYARRVDVFLTLRNSFLVCSTDVAVVMVVNIGKLDISCSRFSSACRTLASAIFIKPFPNFGVKWVHDILSKFCASGC
jgi:hypothetical protein